MTKSNQLIKLLDDMRDLATNTDTEVIHIRADDLLVDCIKLLSDNTIDKDKCNKLIEAYHEIPKWFA